MLVVEIAPGDVDLDRLTLSQADGHDGAFCEALAGFVQWLAPQYGVIREKLRRDVEDRRTEVARAIPEAHGRTLDTIANLAVGFHLWLAYAVDSGALPQVDADALEAEAWETLKRLATAQAQHQLDSEPAALFTKLVSAALASGMAHVTPPNGDVQCAQGHRIGWVDGSDLYLEPETAYMVANEMAQCTGGSLPASKTLHKRLHERGLLASTDDQREKLLVRKTLGGQRREVLHFRAAAFGLQEPAQSAQSAQAGRRREPTADRGPDDA